MLLGYRPAIKIPQEGHHFLRPEDKLKGTNQNVTFTETLCHEFLGYYFRVIPPLGTLEGT